MMTCRSNIAIRNGDIIIYAPKPVITEMDYWEHYVVKCANACPTIAEFEKFHKWMVCKYLIRRGEPKVIDLTGKDKNED